MSFAITAEFPLGTYRAHEGEGQLDRWPSPARLNSALLAAAGSGIRAIADEHGLSPRAIDLAALDWLESNPPDGLALPLHRVNASDATAFRDLGLVGPGKKVKRRAKVDSSEVAFSASVMWVWEAGPPEDLATALDDLSADVPYLGSSDSPVRLGTLGTSRTVSHARVVEPSLTNGRGDDVDLVTARPGRTAALVEDHRRRSAEAEPSQARDRYRTDEDEERRPVVPDALGIERYARVRPTMPDHTPWSELWVLPTTSGPGPITGSDRVRWAVALHRALVAVHGDGAPAMLTGHYAAGVSKPANRIAIQVVDRGPAVAADLTAQQAFVLAIPSDAAPEDVMAVAEACDRLSFVTARGKRLNLASPADRPDPVGATGFWAPPRDGLTRVWAVSPAVPDTRPQRGASWTMADTVALSLALVHRSHFLDGHIRSLRGEHRYRALADAARAAGVVVLQSRKLDSANQTAYAHKVPEGLVVQPYVATVDLGRLGRGDTTWQAIGQSRHLGGGMLRPLDVDPAFLEVWSTL